LSSSLASGLGTEFCAAERFSVSGDDWATVKGAAQQISAAKHSKNTRFIGCPPARLRKRDAARCSQFHAPGAWIPSAIQPSPPLSLVRSPRGPVRGRLELVTGLL